jgi:hypothetical protein
MSWSIGFDENWQRDVGYGVPSICDMPGCDAQIDRGLGYVCGGEPYGGDDGCGLYFCSKHGGGLSHCNKTHKNLDAKPDLPCWVLHKLIDESWEQWRKENPDFVKLNENL